MKQGGTLADVLNEIRVIEQNKRDFVEPQAAIRMTMDPLVLEAAQQINHEPMLQLIQHPGATSEVVAGPALRMTKRAHEQLPGARPIPQSFYDSLRRE